MVESDLLIPEAWLRASVDSRHLYRQRMLE